jgi:hypothetical protein
MPVKCAGGFAIGLFGALCGAAPSYGQAPAQLQDEGVQAGAKVRIDYDSNLLRLDDGVVAPIGRSKDDVVTSASAYARAHLVFGMQKFAATAEYGRDFYAKNSFLDRERIAVDSRLDWRVGLRCSGDAQIAYGKAQGDLSEQALLVANAREIFNVSATGGCVVGLGWKPTLYLRQTNVRNSNPIQAGADSEQFAYGAGLAYRRTRTVGLELDYRKIEVRYPNRIDPATGGRSRVDMDTLGAQMNLRLANRISLDLTGAHYWITGESGRRFRLFAGGAKLAADITPRFRIEGQATREVQVPNYVLASFVINDRFELGSTYRISPKTMIRLRAGQEHNDFESPRPTPSGDLRTFDKRNYVAADATFRPFRSVEINAEYQYIKRTTDSLFGSYKGSQILIQATLAI